MPARKPLMAKALTMARRVEMPDAGGGGGSEPDRQDGPACLRAPDVVDHQQRTTEEREEEHDEPLVVGEVDRAENRSRQVPPVPVVAQGIDLEQRLVGDESQGQRGQGERESP